MFLILSSLALLALQASIPSAEAKGSATPPTSTQAQTQTSDAPPPVPFHVYPESASPATPIGNQGDWFPQNAYPIDARQAGVEGRVAVRVNVDPEGIPRQCDVVSSSGNASLDETTCALAMRNGRFNPARDKAGKAVWSTFETRGVRWELDGIIQVPLAAFTQIVKFDLASEGSILTCKTELHGAFSRQNLGDPCGTFQTVPAGMMLGMKGDLRDERATVTWQIELIPDGDPAFEEAYRKPDEKITSLVRIHFEVTAEGNVVSCAVTEARGKGKDVSQCDDSIGPFLPDPKGPAAAPRGASQLIAISYAPS